MQQGLVGSVSEKEIDRWPGSALPDTKRGIGVTDIVGAVEMARETPFLVAACGAGQREGIVAAHRILAHRQQGPDILIKELVH